MEISRPSSGIFYRVETTRFPSLYSLCFSVTSILTRLITIESNLLGHDFSIPFASSRSIGDKQLRVILLDASALQDSCRQKTISRLDRFSSLTEGHDIVIAFLQSEDPLEAQPAERRRCCLDYLLDLQSMFVSDAHG